MSNVTAATVREFYNAKPERLARLDASARKTVEFDENGRAPRGRLHPKAIKAYNKGRKNQYVLGSTTEAMKARTEHRAALVAQGLAGRRGPVKSSVSLSKD